jgi:glycosyltransferase involved in cell wall biosynthesis
VIGWDRSGDLPSQQSQDGYSIFRRRILAGYARGLLNLIPLFIWQASLLAWLIKRRNDFDILHACDFDTILPALLCKRLFRKIVVYDIFDFYADHLRATPVWLIRWIRRADLWAIDQADAVILVDEARKAQIAGARTKNLTILYNTPEDCIPEVIEKSGEYSLRLAYIGLLQFERGLLVTLQVLKMHPEWRLDLAGFGGDQAEILAIAEKLPNVKWHGRISYENTLAISATADGLLALYDPSIPNHRYASPNKLFEAMMLGKTVVVARDTNMDRIVEEAQMGLVVEYGKINELENALTELTNNPQSRERFGKNARRAYDQKYGWPVMEKRLVNLYKAITTQHYHD